MAEIRVSRPVLKRMIEHALADYPLECCGLLSGRGKVIDGIVPATNQRMSSTAFAIPPRELIAFMKSVRLDSREFLGIYHSHPVGEPWPSARDVSEFYYPEVSYWIISVAGEPRIRCFGWKTRGLYEVGFEVLESEPAEARPRRSHLPCLAHRSLV